MTYRAGIIGAGGVAGMGLLGVHEDESLGEQKAWASHAGGYETAEGIELVAIADVDPDRLERFGEAWDVPAEGQYEDHAAMLDAEDLDAVSVCTPTMLHHEHVIDAARSGVPDVIWCEKPIASGVTDAERMIEACDDAGVELVVNHSQRFTDKLRTLADHLHDDDLLGTVHAVHAQFRMELMRNSTHLIDTLVYLLDSRAEQVSGYITGENEAIDTLEVDREIDDAGGGGFLVAEDGTFVTLDCTMPREASSMCYILIGSAGKLYLNNDDGEWRYWRLEDGEHVEEPLPGIEGAWTWDEDYRLAFANAAGHLVDLLDGEAENWSSGRDALRSLEIIVGLYASHHTGGRVTYPLDRPLKDITITSW